VIRRDQPGVSDDVVDERDRHRARIDEIVDLDGRWARCEDFRPGVAGIAVEVDGDVDLEVANQRVYFGAAPGPHGDEAVERGFDPAPGRAAVVWAE
jgi:hypothetical protein